jgi:hypothetical protein
VGVLAGREEDDGEEALHLHTHHASRCTKNALSHTPFKPRKQQHKHKNQLDY